MTPSPPVWISIGQFAPPQSSAYPTIADFMLTYAVYVDVRGFALGIPAQLARGAQYANPQAYLLNMIAYAKSLTQNTFIPGYVPSGYAWDPVSAAVTAVMNGFSALAELPVNIADPNTVSVMQAWVNGTGALYGGHPAAQALSGANQQTGQSAVSAAGGPSIL